MNKGQITTEFLVTLIILFSLFSVIVFISIQQKENLNFNSNKIKAKTLMEKTAMTVNWVFLGGNGTETTITKKFDFELEFEENTLKIKFGKGQFVSTSLITRDIEFTSTASANKIKIKNLKGVIKIEEL